MRVLVTGGAGFIGSHVVDYLLANGVDVVVVDNLSHGLLSRVPAGAQFIQGDVLHSSEWLAKVSEADALIHLAAQINVPHSEKFPQDDVRTNVLGTVEMLQAARQLHCREFRLASSAAVYGDNPRVPLDESEEAAPLSYYGLDKWVSEQYLRHEDKLGRMCGTVLRLANVYGPRQRAQGEGAVVAVFSDAAARGGSPVIDGDGGQTRDFVFVRDVARAFCYRLCETQHGGLYNIGTETATSIKELWGLLAAKAGVPTDAVKAGPAREGDIRHSRLKVQRAGAWGFHPIVSLSEGLSETLNWFRENL